MSDQDTQLETESTQIVSEQNSENDKTSDESREDGAVKYSTHKKLLNQLKNKGEELEELRAFKKQFEENEAKKKGDYEALLKSRESRIEELESKLTSYETTLIEGQKLQAFVDNLPGKVKRQEYLSFVDLDDIALDPETNRVDEHALRLAVEKFVKEHGHLIETGQKNTLPKVGSLGGRPNMKRSLKDLTREELRQAYLNGDFKD